MAVVHDFDETQGDRHRARGPVPDLLADATWRPPSGEPGSRALFAIVLTAATVAGVTASALLLPRLARV